MRIKKLYQFLLQTFLPLLFMTFFICLFIVLMQFLWKSVDEMVGKGLDISVLAELFVYAAATLTPTALPLAVLLASLMAFGNMGERFELLAMKAAGVSLTRIMRPIALVVVVLSVGIFFFQDIVLPIAQVKMWGLMFSMRQKSPELDIPEGVFYDQINGYNIFVKEKNKKTGALYEMMIYDFSKGFDDAMVIAADSGKLKLTEDKKYLFLTLYNGESFENLKNQRTSQANVPYRREIFALKEILIPFDGNFTRMDESFLQNQYIGKDTHHLRTSIDSLRQMVDSVGNDYGLELKRNDYFSMYNYTPDTANVIPVGSINLDSTYHSLSTQAYQTVVERAQGRAENIKNNFEYKALMLQGEQRILRRHQIELHRKFAVAFACLVFFFIGAPLGAIIRKGGLGAPVVISVILFIFYYMIDNTGYKMARDGMWQVWQGMWLSSAALIPLGVFFTYKAVNDSVLLQPDAYILAFKRFFGSRRIRTLELKSVIIEKVEKPVLEQQIEALQSITTAYLTQNLSPKSYSFLGVFTGKISYSLFMKLSSRLESFVVYAGNSTQQKVISYLTQLPILKPSFICFLLQKKWIAYTILPIFPLSLLFYFVVRHWAKETIEELQDIKSITQTIKELI